LRFSPLEGRTDVDPECHDLTLKEELTQRGLLLPLRDALTSDVPAVTVASVDTAWDALHAQIRGDRAIANPGKQVSFPRAFGKQTLRASVGLGKHSLLAIGTAATAIALTLFTVIGWNQHSAHLEQRYHTRARERATVRLADGGTVILAPVTTLTVLGDAMTVMGEAYFTVTPRAHRAFVVQTDNAIMRVLGTRFTVRHYMQDSETQLVVGEGKVSVEDRRDGLSRDPQVVSTGMLARVDSTGIAITTGIQPSDYLGWTQGNLVFDRVPMRNVVAELERAYGMPIRIADTTLASRRVRTVVSLTEDPLDLVLESICAVVDAHVIRNEHAFVLLPGRAATRAPARAPAQLHSLPEKQYGK